MSLVWRQHAPEERERSVRFAFQAPECGRSRVVQAGRCERLYREFDPHRPPQNSVGAAGSACQMTPTGATPAKTVLGVRLVAGRESLKLAASVRFAHPQPGSGFG